ncbi:family 1 glycosylhydrolase [Cohnella nanjingensis]|uniref:Family 1 glycosylhydrolase n=1 Tax=Cohnella nanjingensis TaxID=1387779 RepID=A0A7X0RQT9_9BACL|nr:family 1 glycosylhydrolase [Cohnella nanjingensis]MBB6671856.1 family 1 glycosylhydrolase [Cohnella nanjingensis]
MREKESWIWALGIEDTFIGQTNRQERPLDEYELTQHYRFWKEDLDAARATGATMIRYGIPWYKVEPEPDVFDWSWVDPVMKDFALHPEMTPIIDLMHYGTPSWLKNEFMNGQYPERVASYASAFAERYGELVRYYTPLNEPYINAEWSGWTGTWPPYMKGHLGFVQMMKQLSKGIILTMEAVRKQRSDALFVHVEASKLFLTNDPSLTKETALWNEIRYMMWELIQGFVGEDHPLYAWLIDHGVTEEDFSWYRERAVELDIVGINYYPQFSVNEITRETLDQELVPSVIPGTGEHLVQIAEDIYRRYKKPVFITETSYKGTVEQRIDWMEELFVSCRKIVDGGVDLIGVTWFPFLDMVDWPYRNNDRTLVENIVTFGLVTLEQQADGTLKRVKNAAYERFEEEIRRSGEPYHK